MKIYFNNILKKGNKVTNEKEKVFIEGKLNKEENNIEDTIDKQSELREKYVRKGAYSKKALLKNDVFKKEKFKINKYNLPKSYYVLLFFMVGLAVLSVKLVRSSYTEYSEEDYAVFNSEDKIVEEDIITNQSINSSNLDTRNDVNEESSTQASTNVINKVQEKVNKINVVKEEKLVFAKPHDGEISKIFSEDKVIYSKTLEMWKIHDGIDVKGEIGDLVYSVEKGKVEKIYEDAFYGITIVIDHGQGYKSSYSNLEVGTLVKEGESIKKLQKIGKIGNTSIGEIKDLPHLHFTLFKNGEIVDPTSIFK